MTGKRASGPTRTISYLALLHDCTSKSGCALHAYCLMTNHVHLLLTPSTPQACAVLMRRLGQRYVQYFNRRYERSGTLWEGRFRSCLVDSASYVLACHRYIELNPVRAGMVSDPHGYRWSSHKAYTGAAQSKLLAPHAEYVALGGDQEKRHLAYRQIFSAGDEPAFLAAVRDATNAGFPLVGAELKSRLSATSERALERKKPGPPPATEERDLDRLSAQLGF